MSVEPPAWIGDLYKTFELEELVSVLRHDLRNRLASVRNARFFLHKKLSTGAPELSATPRVAQMFELIESEIAAAETLLSSKYPPLVPDAHSDVGAVLGRLAAELVWPAGVRVELAAQAKVAAAVPEAELALAVYCLAANAAEARAGGLVALSCTVTPEGPRVEVSDDGPGLTPAETERCLQPGFSTKPGRQGMGLNIVRRVAGRARGKLELGAAPGGGLRACLSLTAAS